MPRGPEPRLRYIGRADAARLRMAACLRVKKLRNRSRIKWKSHRASASSRWLKKNKSSRRIESIRKERPGMKIDFSAVIKDLDGEAVKDGDKVATLGRVACTALLASYADEQNLPAEDKVRRFLLAEIAAKGGEREVKVEDAALIKQLIGKAFAPLVVASAYDIIEPPSA